VFPWRVNGWFGIGFFVYYLLMTPLLFQVTFVTPFCVVMANCRVPLTSRSAAHFRLCCSGLLFEQEGLSAQSTALGACDKQGGAFTSCMCPMLLANL